MEINSIAKYLLEKLGFEEDGDSMVTDDYEITRLPNRPGDTPYTIKTYYAINGRVFGNFIKLMNWMVRNNITGKDGKRDVD